MVMESIEELKASKPKLQQFEDQIIAFFSENPDIDGDKLSAMKRKGFGKRVAEHCDTKKVKGVAGALFQKIVEKITAKNEVLFHFKSHMSELEGFSYFFERLDSDHCNISMLSQK